jgi:hypothetical protein
MKIKILGLSPKEILVPSEGTALPLEFRKPPGLFSFLPTGDP